MDISDLYKKFKNCNQDISTDTRSIIPGSIFFAWKGAHHDGNEFAAEALEKGATYVVVDNPDYAIGDKYILVNNSIETLQQLAIHHRRQFQVPVLAIAGSNGKTTTKELISKILGKQKDVVASFGSLNNHVGVPLTLLRMSKLTDIVVVEMGANHIGEIAKLCSIAEPTHGLITNIGRDHIGLFGNQEAIITANVELYNYLRQTKGFVFVNRHNMTLMKYGEGIEHLCYGEGLKNEYGINSQDTTPYVSFLWKHKPVITQLTGEYNLENIAAAIAIGVYFSITEGNIISAIESYVPQNNRSELIETKRGNIVIKDFYNANLTSMKFALENLAHIKKHNLEKKSIAIMGDMLELGEFSRGDHQAAVDYAKELEVDEIILVGKEFAQTKHEGSESYRDVEEVIFALQKFPCKNSVILLKASKNHPTTPIFTKLFNEVEW